jgi:isopenicillin N synthase-like dioxygenase
MSFFYAMRCAGSTDTECVTLLHFDAPGLEVLINRGQASGDEPRWLALPSAQALGGCWAVIFGDALAVLTNGSIPATVHRVRRLPLAQPRTSLVMFIATDRLVAPPAAFGPSVRSAKSLNDWWERAIAVSGAVL